MGGCVTQASIMRNVRDPLVLHLNQKYLKSGKKRLSYGQFTNKRLRDSSENHAGCMGSIRAFEPKRSKNQARHGWVFANLLMGGWVTPVSIMQDVWDPLGLYLNKKVLKSVKKRLSYGRFTNGRLRVSSEYHARCMGSIRASFEPKRSKIRLEMAELWPIYQWEVAWLKRVSGGT